MLTGKDKSQATETEAPGNTSEECVSGAGRVGDVLEVVGLDHRYGVGDGRALIVADFGLVDGFGPDIQGLLIRARRW